MDRKYLILTLVVMMVVIAAAIAAVMFNPAEAKEPTQVNITSDSQQYEGGNLSLLLTDLNNTPISNQVVNVTITDDDNETVARSTLKTGSEGRAEMLLDLSPGEYLVNVSYGGNENYTGNTTSQNLTVIEVVQAVVEQPSSSITYDSELNLYYDGNGVVVDPDGEHGQCVGMDYYYLKDLADSGFTPD